MEALALSPPVLPADLCKLAILLDVDGTILDIAPTPQEVRASPSLRQTLMRLSNRVDGALALVSGRPIDNLDHIFAPLRLASVGVHGAEIRPRANGNIDPSRISPLDKQLKQRFAAITLDQPGVFIEDKGYSIALHYRSVPTSGHAVLKAVDAICTDYPDAAFEILPGKCVIEIKRAGFNKGTAVRELMTHKPFSGRHPIFLGDDKTDETVFAILPEFDGVPISVGRIVPGVFCHFDTPHTVRRWLERLSEGNGFSPL